MYYCKYMGWVIILILMILNDTQSVCWLSLFIAKLKWLLLNKLYDSYDYEWYIW